MNVLLLWVGRLAGLAGALICLWAVFGRLTGTYYTASFQVGTLLLAGTAAMVVGCLCLLLVLTRTERL